MARHIVRALVLGALLLPVAAHAATVSAAGTFDVTAATRAYLDTLSGAARAKSDAYFEGGYWLILWGALITIASDALLLRFRLSAWMRDRAAAITAGRFRQTWITALFYTLWGMIVTLPWSIYRGFFREHQYGLSNQDFAAWALDYAKGAGIGLVLGPLGFAVLYAVIRRFPRNWWLLGTGLMGAATLLGTMIAPVYLLPLFNTFAELAPGPVRDRIVGLAQANHIPAEHIYVFDASRQSDRISANVSGLGPTNRISLNDNLLKRTTLPETAAVMGHEMGHYVMGHGLRNTLLTTLLFGVLMLGASRIVPVVVARWGARWGIRDVGDPASMPVFGIVLAALSLIAVPLQNTIIRTAESQADGFGLNAAREPDGWAQIAMKLSQYRKVEPGPIEEMLFFDHPSGATRVRMGMQWKHDHVANAQMIVPPPLAQASAAPK